ncbi:MAG: cytochrome c [Epsilonproteobacteria bacterium]|nr:MAG: cytochrome c [Campylobacterota bacterium]
MKKIVLTLLVASVGLMAADGAALYKKCAACHGAKGEKAALGKSAVIGGVDAATIAADLKGYKAGTTNKKGMGALMKGQVAAYDDAQIEAVSAYIAGLK